MTPLAKRLEERYTYQDYLTWDDGERWEIINGEAYNMSPSPTRKHQIISGNLFFQIKNFINKKKQKCRVYEAPMDVIFDDLNVVQPDIFIVCEKDKDSDYVVDVPELIIEIISKSTAYKDTTFKKDLYEKFGVKEYILIYPDYEIVERYFLVNDKYEIPEKFNWDEVLKLKTFDIEIPLWEVFEKEKTKD